MNEGVKTIIFAVAALVIVVGAFISKPRSVTPKIGDGIGEPLFSDFTDPADARELKIVQYDEGKGELSEFEIKRVAGRWVIPSHSNYPADAETQLKEAATCLIDLMVVDTMTDAVDDHKLYGVVAPDKELKAGDEGVGILVAMKGADGKALADFVISNKKVAAHADKKFVRKVGEDRVYVVKIDPAKLSTKFSDWIKKDLLKLSAFDVDQIQLKDYSVAMVLNDQGPEVRHNQRLDLTATQEASGTPNWKLDKLISYRGREPVPTVLADDEELNGTKLDDLKSALDNLEIVDVRKKPKGLGANLRAEEGLLKDREGIQSLAALGFLPLRIGQGPADIYAANGEVLVRMKDGVEYVLRFGNIQGSEEGNTEKLNRYLLVTTQVNEAKFPPPVLEPLPDEPGDEPAAPKEEDAKEEGKPAAEKKAAEKKEGDQKEPDPADEAKQKEDAKKAAERKKAEIKAQRERITKENKRKEDDHKANRKKAEDKVRELNARFADWYYVISEDVYKKVHLSRIDLVKERTAALDEGFGVDAFRKLEEGGLKKESEKKGTGFNPPGLPPGLPKFPGSGE